jgi:signal transduction histidine kinase
MDLAVLLLGALGAYALAGRTLRTIAEAQARQERFAVAASHELRTPLTVLLGTLEAALLRPRTPEEYEDVVRRAQAEAEHLVILLDDVLTLAHAQSGAAARIAAPLDLHAVAHASAADIRAQAVGKKQTVVVAVEGPLPARGDAQALQQAITNLLDNAVTYTPMGGTIHLAGRRGRRHVLLVVRDTGPGIAPEHLPHLFEPFYRVDPARGNGVGHVGLGLVRAAHVARAHGGRLTIESQLGVGTAATLALPLDAVTGDGDRRPEEPAPVEVSR